MMRADRMTFVGMLFLIPTMLCFVGIGAFLHIAVRAAAEQHEQTRYKAQKQIEKDTEKANELREAIKRLERQIEEIRKGQAALNHAQDREKELSELRALKKRLQDELSSLKRKLEQLERRLGERGEACHDLRRQVAEARRKLEELKQRLADMGPPSKDAQDGGEQQDEPSLAELRARIARLKAQLGQQERKNEQAEAEWDGLRQQYSDPRIKVDEIRGSANWQPPPHPLYVECDRRGVVLQPEGVRLPAEPDQAERDRFVLTARQRRYVLFLIRPDGFDSFRRYRSLVPATSVDFGYEPIKQQGQVIYPETR